MDISKKDLSDIIEKKLYSAGEEFLELAFKKLELEDKEKIDPEEAFSAFELIKEGMHTPISKKAIDSCIEELKKFIESSEGEE